MIRTQRLFLASLVLTIGIGLIPVLAPALMQGMLAIPTLMVITVLTIIILLSVLSGTQEIAVPEKRKRSPRHKGGDSDLAQFVNDLDDWERDELRWLLDEDETVGARRLSATSEGETLANDDPRRPGLRR
jgi:hypothetical protein